MSQKIGKLFFRNLKQPAIWFAATILAIAFAVNVTPARTEDSSVSTNAKVAAEAKQSIRNEGDELNRQRGNFRRTSGRIWFVPSSDPKAAIACLENLMLQRITRALDDQSNFNDWLVSGELTQYDEANYLLVKAARRAE